MNVFSYKKKTVKIEVSIFYLYLCNNNNCFVKRNICVHIFTRMFPGDVTEESGGINYLQQHVDLNEFIEIKSYITDIKKISV